MHDRPTPAHEAARVNALRSTHIVASAGEGYFGHIVAGLRAHFACGIAALDFIEADMQWTKAAVGDLPSVLPREVTFCTHAILSDAVMIVRDAREDARFRANPLVTGPPFIRAYAGAPLIDRNGYRLGVICVIDGARLRLGETDIAILQDAAYRIMRHIELHRIRMTEPGSVLRRLLADVDRAQEGTDRQAAALDLDVLRAYFDEQEEDPTS